MKLKIYSDGGARGNPGPAGIGVVVCDDSDGILFRYADAIGRATNNTAEYCALIAGLELAKRFQAAEVECYTDSELLKNQLSGKFKIKAPHIRFLYERAKKSALQFRSITYHQRPRETTLLREADRLVNDALDRQEKERP
jgi:ribonuclease HI